MADLLSFAPVRVFDDNGDPGAGYKASFYRSGTTSAVTVYASDGVTVLEQPVEADAEGVFPAVLFQDAGAVKAVITDASDATVYTVDPIVKVPAGASGASEVTFSPTVDLPYDNVQEAIEGAAATAASGFTPYGLGVTGLNALIADIDATGTASGAYRYDGTTTGTFPSGVTASDTGIVEIWRETSGEAVMFLYPGATTDRAFMRRMTSSAWGSWREVITANVGATEGDILYRGASTWVRLPKGVAGQRLIINNAETAPEWVGPMTYTDVSGSRTVNTNYTNSSHRPLMVVANITYTASNTDTQFYINGVVFSRFFIGNGLSGLGFTYSIIVPPGATYRVNRTAGSTSILEWREALL